MTTYKFNATIDTGDRQTGRTTALAQIIVDHALGSIEQCATPMHVYCGHRDAVLEMCELVFERLPFDRVTTRSSNLIILDARLKLLFLSSRERLYCPTLERAYYTHDAIERRCSDIITELRTLNDHVKIYQERL